MDSTDISQFADEEAFRGFSFDPSLYNYEDNRTEGDDHHHHEKEEESEEEADGTRRKILPHCLCALYFDKRDT